MIYLLQLFLCFALQGSDRLFFKGFGKNLCDEGVKACLKQNIFGVSEIFFAIFLALPESIKMIRVHSTLSIIKCRLLIKMEATLASYVLVAVSLYLCYLQELNNCILEHTGYLWVMKKLKKCWF